MLKLKYLSLICLITACCLIEMALSLSDFGAVASDNTRRLTYYNGAFWPGLLNGWKPNYAIQPFAMFITYSFLHSGFVHLTINMITLLSLGRLVVDRIGQGLFTVLYFGTGICGAALFALLSSGVRPMVGASGALFGLLGAILAWEYADRFAEDIDRRNVAWVVLMLAVMNLLLWWAMDGQLAWQTHLGGFVAGWIIAGQIKPKHPDEASD